MTNKADKKLADLSMDTLAGAGPRQINGVSGGSPTGVTDWIQAKKSNEWLRTLAPPGHGHICAFFHDLDEEYGVLLPFIKKGFAKQEKAFHIVDPKLKQEHMRRLELAGIDVKPAEARRQLEVKVWEETYLRSGRFDPHAMLNLVEDVLKSGRSQGFGATRFIAHMNWIFEDQPTVEEFLKYEAQLNYILPKYEDPVICVHNFAKYDSEIALDILRTHPVVLIGGVMQRNPFFMPPAEFLEEVRERRTGARLLGTGIIAEDQTSRQALRDLVALSSMPAKWFASEPGQIAEETVGILMSGLRLETAYIRLKRGDGTVAETIRSENSPEFAAWLGSVDAQGSADGIPALRRIELPTERRNLNVVQIPVGMEMEAGYIAVGSSRADFPTETEAMLLSAAANQGFASFQNARLSHERLRAETEVQVLKEEIEQSAMFDEVIGSSTALGSVMSKVARVAPADSTVLITGETGTGKELIARAIHKGSKRAAAPFISVNCAALPVTLIASELFGHEKGAFTGAQQRRLGRFELAQGGTIFLDEVGELPLETQVMLLRVLQERTFERVGGGQQIFIDVRVLAATNRDLHASISTETFRSDLFYRLNVFPIAVPPLRERKEDIPALVRHFVDRYAATLGKKIRTIDRATMEMLQGYHWPGNIRELQNVVERSLILCDGETFSVDVAWLAVDAPHGKSGSLSERVIGYEKEIIENALTECKGKVAGPTGASARLGIPSTTLESRIKALKINKNQFKR